MYQIGFDHDKYLQMQSQSIRERIEQFGNKLYLEFGGKLYDDFHASRVLPGFPPDIKINLLKTLADQAEIIVAINANHIEKAKVREDYGISYDMDVLRLIDAFKASGLFVGSVVITQYAAQPAAERFRDRLGELGVRAYCHYPIPGYPTNIPYIVSPEGYGRNEYIETTRPLVIVTAPGPTSGKMSTCLSQMYHEHIRGVTAGYAKFETFPIWNLPLKHPVNLAYEAATADLNDINMIDPFHLEAYGVTAVNYNRDVELYPVLRTILNRIGKPDIYKSPTDMGVNMAGFAISDDEACRAAAKQEILRRYFGFLVDRRKGQGDDAYIRRAEMLMNDAGITINDRAVVTAALDKSEASGTPSVALELADGTMVTGRTSDLLGASSAALINAFKHLARINHQVRIISPLLIEQVQKLKVGFLGNINPRMHMDELLIALAATAPTNPTVELALDQLPKLQNCEAHSTVILSSADTELFRKLGVNLTCEPVYQYNRLYHHA